MADSSDIANALIAKLGSDTELLALCPNGVYRDQDGTAERALFVLDTGGVIRWSYVSPVGVNPGADGILSALEALPAPTGASQ